MDQTFGLNRTDPSNAIFMPRQAWLWTNARTPACVAGCPTGRAPASQCRRQPGRRGRVCAVAPMACVPFKSGGRPSSTSSTSADGLAPNTGRGFSRRTRSKAQRVTSVVGVVVARNRGLSPTLTRGLCQRARFGPCNRRRCARRPRRTGPGEWMVTRRLVVAITGASGAIYGLRALEVLRDLPEVEVHLIISDSGRATIAQELGPSLAEVRSLADVVHPFRELGASIASGSFRTEGMLVAPCSIRTLSAIATCATGDLVSRAADVVLKERRRLVLLVRETPLHAGHLRLMLQATESGAIVMPPVPAFYPNPTSIAELVDHTVGRALDLLGVDANLVSRWDGMADWARSPSRRSPSQPS